MSFKLKVHKIFRILRYRRKIFAKKLGVENIFKKGTIVSFDSTIGSYNFFGKNTGINNSDIGNFCSFAPNVQIGPGEHSLNFVTTSQRIARPLINFSLSSKRCEIGSDVWCGCNSVVLQGVKVGHGAIIGSNAVVTKDVPDYAIVVGVPARFLRYRFEDETIKEILESKWFENNLKDAKRIVREMINSMKEND
jgi:acetyltransferase-like isoleucine patch superfamily enzyme